eukprot:4937658-Lingulodinium_polyedra.AAC.1
MLLGCYATAVQCRSVALGRLFGGCSAAVCWPRCLFVATTRTPHARALHAQASFGLRVECAS